MAQQIDTTPTDPDTARAQLEQTRARMSDTLDEIEDVLVRKKAEIRDRMDVAARVREKPLHAAGLVLGLGFLVGFLTGGRSGKDDDVIVVDSRSAIWEARARRLLRIAREQETEIDRLETNLAALEDAEEEFVDYDWEEDEEPESRLGAFRDVLVDRAGRVLGEASRALVDGLKARG